MNARFARWPLAALAAIACASSTALADDVPLDYQVILSWQAPTQNTDGTPIEELQGYNIYWGMSADSMYLRFYTNAPNSGVLFVFPDQRPRYFGVTAVNASGIESAMTGPLVWPSQ